MRAKLARMLLGATSALAAASASAQDWGTFGLISSTLGNNENRLCVGAPANMRPGDVGCPGYAPYVTNGGRVGIGTDAPSSTLHILSNNPVISFTDTDAPAYGITLGQFGTTFQIAPTVSNMAMVFGGGGASRVVLKTNGNGLGIQLVTSNTEYARLTAAGLFGINVQSPTATLQVSGSFIVSTSAQTTSPSLYVGSNGYIGLGTSSPLGRLSFGTPGDTVSFTTTSSTILDLMQIKESNNRLMLQAYKSGSGGTTLFVSRSHVEIQAAGGAGSGLDPSNTAIFGGLAFTGSSGTNHWLWISSNGSSAGISTPKAIPLHLRTNNTTRMTLDSSGSVGIGTTLPSATLHVSGTAGITSWTMIAANRTPGAELDVQGTVSATNFVGDGSGLSGVIAGSSDRIVSGTTQMVAISNTGYISYTTAGVTTGYFSPAGVMVLNGISVSTNQMSATTIYASDQMSIRGVPLIVTGTSMVLGRTNGAGIAANNTAVGYQALNSTTTGVQNTAIGQQALRGTTTGGSNVANGYQALLNNTTAGGNVAVGHQALLNNTTGVSNVANGWQALLTNTTGTNNIGIGAWALMSNSTGTGNVAVGYTALWLTTVGGNVAVGHQALQNNTTASGNTATGYQALQQNAATAGGNTANGYRVLWNNLAGGGNVAVGYQSLYQHQSSSSQTAVGYSAMENVSGTAADPARFNTGVGFRALRGHGTATFNSGDANTALGHDAGLVVNAGSSNTLLGYQAGNAITSGSNNIIIGTDVDAPTAASSNALNIGNSIFGDMSGAAASVGGDAKIGINWVTPTVALEVSGTISATAFVGDGSSLTGVGSAPAGVSGSIQFKSGSVLAGRNDIIIDDTGRVGIATANPSATLDVSGTVNVSGTLKVAGTGAETCGPSSYGTIRYNAAIQGFQMCRP